MVFSLLRGGSGGVLGSQDPPPEKYQRNEKSDILVRIRTHQNALFLEVSVISALYEIKQPIYSKGLHSPHPYSIFD